MSEDIKFKRAIVGNTYEYIVLSKLIPMDEHIIIRVVRDNDIDARVSKREDMRSRISKS